MNHISSRKLFSAFLVYFCLKSKRQNPRESKRLRRFFLNFFLILFLISQTITGIFTPLTPPYFKTQEVRAAGESWYNSSWLYRKKITIDHTKVAADQSNFPVLINLPTDSDLASHAKSNGDDILFTSSDGITKLAHEIEKYDNTSGQLVADVKVPSVSSTTDTDIYLYYGNSGASNQQNATSVWDSNFVAVQHLNEDPSTSGLLPILDSTNNKLDATSSGTLTSGSQVNGQIAGSLQFDGTDDYVVYHPSNVVWTKSGSNPMITGQFGSMWYNGANDYHAYYSDGTNVLHATSTDGISWTVDSTHNPVLAPTVGSWDSGWIEVVQVWKEGSTWYMLYRGHSASSSERKIGLATSADGLNWTKNANNPVLSASPATWEVSDGLGLDPWGIIKIGSTYYLWYNTVNSTGSGTRATGLATSTDLIHWTKDTNNPIFQGGRYCVTPFKYGSYYYLLVPHYDGAAAHMELYRDTNPTFYPNEREFLGSILEEGTGWDSGYLDTPSVLTNDINRNSFPDTNIWMYYTGYTAFSGNIWKEGLAEFPLSDLANLETIPSKELDITSAITLEAWVKINSTTATYPLIFDRSQAYGLGLHMVSSKLYPMMELKTNLSWRFTSNGTSQVSTGQWHYIVGSYDSSHNTISYYVDGQPAGTDITNGQGNIATSSSNLKLQNPPNYAFNGNVDEARISNTARQSV
jgi:hypothetical protein